MMKMRSQQGSFILEAIISLLLIAIGLIAVIALSTQALNQTGQSRARNEASYLAGELIGEMWVNASIDLTNWKARVATLPGGTAEVYTTNCDCLTTGAANSCAATGVPDTTAWALGPNAVVTICIKWSDKTTGTVKHNYSTSVQIAK